MSDKTELQSEFEVLKDKVLTKGGQLKSNAKPQEVARYEELKAILESGSDSNAVADPSSDTSPDASNESEKPAVVVAGKTESAQTVCPPAVANIDNVSDPVMKKLLEIDAKLDLIINGLRRSGFVNMNSINKLFKKG